MFPHHACVSSILGNWLAAKVVMSPILFIGPATWNQIFSECRETLLFQQMKMKTAFKYQTLHIHHSAQWSIHLYQQGVEWKGTWGGSPILCFNFCSFSLAVFEFLWPSATCCTKSFIPFSSCSLFSAYLRISWAVFTRHNKETVKNTFFTHNCQSL